ncbi:hypothetical protein INR49_003083 [Caranx melampygus]|nr:hypothetical protein INR49_003083 [Caranx melampygus]
MAKEGRGEESRAAGKQEKTRRCLCRSPHSIVFVWTALSFPELYQEKFSNGREHELKRVFHNYNDALFCLPKTVIMSAPTQLRVVIEETQKDLPLPHLKRVDDNYRAMQ